MKENEAKMKAILKDKILKIKFVIQHIMLGKLEAEKEKLTEDYITHIVLSAGERVLFDLKPSCSFSQNPLFIIKVKQKNLKEGDLLELKWTTLAGYKGYYSKKIKNRVKP